MAEDQAECSTNLQPAISTAHHTEVSLSTWIESKNNVIDQVLAFLNKIPSTAIKEETEIELLDFKTKKNVKAISIVLVGHVGSGKSTLLNALLNIGKCTPTGDEGHSVTQTVVEISASSNEKFEATVELNDEIEWKEIVENYTSSAEEDTEIIEEEVNLRVSRAVEYSTTLKQFIETIFSENEFSDQNPSDYITTQCIEISCDSPEILFKRVSRFVTVKQKCSDVFKFVKCVKMRIPNVELLTKINFIDLPGRGNSKLPSNKKVEEYMNNCDVIWIVTPISRCTGDDSINIVGEKLSKRLQIRGRAGSISFICTMTDVIGDENMEHETFKKCQEEINHTEDKIKINKDKLKAISQNDIKGGADLKIQGYEFTEILGSLTYDKKKLKEGICVLRSAKVKTELDIMFAKTFDENNGVFKVHCVSAKEYVKCIKERPEESEVFTTVEATGIGELFHQMEQIFNKKNYDFKTLQLSKMCNTLTTIVESMLSSMNLTSPGTKKEKSSAGGEPKILLSEMIKHIREEFAADIKKKHQDLENDFIVREISILNSFEKTCASWKECYKPQTYLATVSRNGYFPSHKYGIVNFNEELCEHIIDIIETEWLEFFHFYKPLKDFKEKIVNACAMCYKSTPSKWSLRSNELPKFIEIQVQNAVRDVIESTKKIQLSLIDQMSNAIQECMQPAYTEALLKPRGRGSFKELTSTIENHVQRHKEDMLKKLRETTTVELNNLIKEIEKLIENCCKRTVGDLAKRPMYQLHLKEYNDQKQMKKPFNDILDVLAQLIDLDSDKSISGEAEQLKSKLQQIISSLSKEDGSPATKKPKLTKQ